MKKRGKNYFEFHDVTVDMKSVKTRFSFQCHKVFLSYNFSQISQENSWKSVPQPSSKPSKHSQFTNITSLNFDISDKSHKVKFLEMHFTKSSMKAFLNLKSCFFLQYLSVLHIYRDIQYLKVSFFLHILLFPSSCRNLKVQTSDKLKIFTLKFK